MAAHPQGFGPGSTFRASCKAAYRSSGDFGTWACGTPSRSLVSSFSPLALSPLSLRIELRLECSAASGLVGTVFAIPKAFFLPHLEPGKEGKDRTNDIRGHLAYISVLSSASTRSGMPTEASAEHWEAEEPRWSD